ncbi:MAG: WXG100 family type VII secretion target [Bacilli bacterium]|nr:WXG100 family type VII secretion target [Bacilli bacterium]
MEGNIKYKMVYDASNKIKREVEKLEQELEAYNENIKKIGNDSGVWDGSAATSSNEVLNVIHSNIAELKSICNKFASDARTAAQLYQQTDTQSAKEMENIL